MVSFILDTLLDTFLDTFFGQIFCALTLTYSNYKSTSQCRYCCKAMGQPRPAKFWSRSTPNWSCGNICIASRGTGAQRCIPTTVKQKKFNFDHIYGYVIQVVKTIGIRTQNFNSRVRRFAGVSIPGRDIDFMPCSVFICTLRSFIAVSITFHYTYHLTI